ncbi:hypothetical protein SAMD00019534_010830, partial [Acytostelium subglobosum LB1]|uniref:hypothetical protein n=1 Tax=Acytostelium subglobosum LB1 TaxID=1410327 RepID=UPI000644B67A
ILDCPVATTMYLPPMHMQSLQQMPIQQQVVPQQLQLASSPIPPVKEQKKQKHDKKRSSHSQSQSSPSSSHQHGGKKSPQTRSENTSINTHHHNTLLNQKSKVAYSPYMEIVEQECISVESVILNNRNSSVHIVVKNTSFVIKLRTLDIYALNFSNCHVKCGLYYANEPMKEVSFIQTSPITYVGSSCPQGEYFTIETKISILSSQHQGNLFYILLSVTDNSQKSMPPHAYLSHPIRVVSKVDHIKKDPNGNCEKKQTFIDILTERLSKLENLQAKQSKAVITMMQQRSMDAREYARRDPDGADDPGMGAMDDSSPPSSPPFDQNDDVGDLSTRKKVKSSHQQCSDQRSDSAAGGARMKPADYFLECFNRVIKVYKQEYRGKEDKKIDFSQLLECLDKPDKSTLCDLLDAFTFDDPTVNLSSFNHGEAEICQCPECPYRKQADQLMLLSPIMSFHSPITMISPHDSPSYTPMGLTGRRQSKAMLFPETITEH